MYIFLVLWLEIVYVHPISDYCLGRLRYDPEVINFFLLVYHLWQIWGLSSLYLSVSDETSRI